MAFDCIPCRASMRPGLSRNKSVPRWRRTTRTTTGCAPRSWHFAASSPDPNRRTWSSRTRCSTASHATACTTEKALAEVAGIGPAGLGAVRHPRDRLRSREHTVLVDCIACETLKTRCTATGRSVHDAIRRSASRVIRESHVTLRRFVIAESPSRRSTTRHVVYF